MGKLFLIALLSVFFLVLPPKATALTQQELDTIQQHYDDVNGPGTTTVIDNGDGTFTPHCANGFDTPIDSCAILGGCDREPPPYDTPPDVPYDTPPDVPYDTPPDVPYDTPPYDTPDVPRSSPTPTRTPTPTLQPTPTLVPNACGVTCTRDANCQGSVYSSTNTCIACVGGICKVPPACNSSCVRDSDCNGGPAQRDGCVACVNNACRVPPTPTPTRTPTPTPTRTPTPTLQPTPTLVPNACGVTCTRDANCQGSVYSSTNTCIACVGGICKVPPACNSSCVRDSDCNGGPAQRDGCIQCVSNRCQVPPSPTPTLTPTPPFNAAACKCDGIEYTNLFSGQPTTITSFAKVEGVDVSKAVVQDQKFFFAEGAETTARIIGRSGPIPATVVSSNPSLVRYSSKWTFTLPQLKSGATYRIWSQVNCQPKLQALNYTPAKKAILAATTEEPKSFVERMIDFLNRLFGVGPKTPASPSPTPTTAPVIFRTQDTDTQTNVSRNQLQLGTFVPVEVYQKTCSFIKFRFEQFGQ